MPENKLDSLEAAFYAVAAATVLLVAASAGKAPVDEQADMIDMVAKAAAASLREKVASGEVEI